MGNYTSSTSSPAIPVSWTDDPLVQYTTPIKKVHLTELRAALEAMDGHTHTFNTKTSGAELPNVSVSWAEASSSIVVGTTLIKAAHTQEIIDYIKAFDDHYHNVPDYGNSTQYNLNPTFIDDPVTTSIEIKTTAWEQLRTYMESYGNHTHVVCCECECTCTCECQCTCTCTEDCCSQCDCCD